MIPLIICSRISFTGHKSFTFYATNQYGLVDLVVVICYSSCNLFSVMDLTVKLSPNYIISFYITLGTIRAHIVIVTHKYKL